MATETENRDTAPLSAARVAWIAELTQRPDFAHRMETVRRLNPRMVDTLLSLALSPHMPPP